MDQVSNRLDGRDQVSREIDAVPVLDCRDQAEAVEPGQTRSVERCIRTELAWVSLNQWSLRLYSRVVQPTVDGFTCARTESGRIIDTLRNPSPQNR